MDKKVIEGMDYFEAIKVRYPNSSHVGQLDISLFGEGLQKCEVMLKELRTKAATWTCLSVTDMIPDETVKEANALAEAVKTAFDELKLAVTRAKGILA